MPVINFSYKDLCSLIGEDIPIETLYDRIPMMGAVMVERNMLDDSSLLYTAKGWPERILSAVIST